MSKRKEFLDALRGLIDLLEREPDLPLPHNFGDVYYHKICWYPESVTDGAKIVRALGGSWKKNDPRNSEVDAENLIMDGVTASGLFAHIYMSREGICERKQVGTKTRAVTEVIETGEVEEVPIYEYECKSLLSLVDQKAMDELEAVAK